MKSFLHRRKDKPGSARLSNDSTKRVPGQSEQQVRRGFWRGADRGAARDPVVRVPSSSSDRHPVGSTPQHGRDRSDFCNSTAAFSSWENYYGDCCVER